MINSNHSSNALSTSGGNAYILLKSNAGGSLNEQNEMIVNDYNMGEIDSVGL
jgi:hypothetical protein